MPWEGPEVGQPNRNLDACIGAMEDIRDMTISSLSKLVKTLRYKVLRMRSDDHILE